MTLTLVIGTIAVTSAGAGGRADAPVVGSDAANGPRPSQPAGVPPADYVPRKAYLYVKRLAAKRLRLLGARERRIVSLLKEVRRKTGSKRNTDPVRTSRGVRDVICTVFGAHCSEALRVAWCESRFNVYARNPAGYWGLFQFGSYARARYGFAWDAWTQSRAAYRYFLDAGWSPWACRP